MAQQINIAILVFNLGSSMRAKASQPVDSLVGERIRLLRKRRNMSQTDLGKALGVTFQQFRNMRTERTASAPVGCIRSPPRSTFRSLNSSMVLRGRVARRGRRNQSRLTRRRFASPKPSSKSPTKSCARRWSIWWKRWCRNSALATRAYSACFRVLQGDRDVTAHNNLNATPN